jgi:putative endonuclease
MSWFVYVLTSDGERRTYVGISRDVERRLEQHNGHDPGGARSTRAGRPWALGAVYGPYRDRGVAQSAEARVRKARGAERLSVAEEPRAG